MTLWLLWAHWNRDRQTGRNGEAVLRGNHNVPGRRGWWLSGCGSRVERFKSYYGNSTDSNMVMD